MWNIIANAAAAAAAGYRPCLRCRPEAAPGTPLRGAQRAGRGRVAPDRGRPARPRVSVADLAARIGVGERHLRRLFVAEIGAGPLEIAATRRLLFAKKLLGETQLPITQIAPGRRLRQPAPLQRGVPGRLRPGAARAAPRRTRVDAARTAR